MSEDYELKEETRKLKYVVVTMSVVVAMIFGLGGVL